jgi:predicted Zn-dependent peptidase
MRHHLWKVFCIFLLILPAVASAGLAERVQEYRFANGLTLLVVERHDSPTLAAYITLRVGSVDETSENRGVAHLLEHMLFKGTKTLGTRDFRREKPLLDAIDAAGSEYDRLRMAPQLNARRIAELEVQLQTLQEERRQYDVPQEVAELYAKNGGVDYNAFTSKDLTSYVIELPANKLELWAAIEADRMSHSIFRDFYTERQVVMEERRRSYDSDPDGLLYENLLATAFTLHPYRHPIIGWMSDIDHLSLEKTRAFHARYYVPANTVIALVGDIDFTTAKELVERYFGRIPAGSPAPPVVASEPEQQGEKRAEISFDAEPRLMIAFHKPTLPSRDDYIFDLLNGLLGEGRTSRLYQSLVVKEQQAANISTFTAPGSRYANLFVISATPRAPHTPREVERAVYRELKRLADEEVGAEELERVRNRLRVDFLRNLQKNGALAQMLTYYQSVAGDWRYLVRYDEELAGITPAEIQAAAQRYFNPENRTVITLARPGGGE